MLSTFSHESSPNVRFKAGLYVKSASLCTPASMGETMKGIEASPTTVGKSLPEGGRGSLPTDQTMRLITNPGIATLARPCQMAVSIARDAPIIRRSARVFLPVPVLARQYLSTQSATT